MLSNASHAVAAMVDSGTKLWLNDVRAMAKEEYWQEIHVSEQARRATFLKHCTATNTYVRLHVHCIPGIVGIELDHSRQGKNQVFCENVDSKGMRYILQNPRLAAGYHNSGGKKAKHGDNFAIGDRVEVAGCGQRGYAELTDLENYSGNLRILFSDGESFRVPKDRLTKIHTAPLAVCPSLGKCQSLKNEARLQLTRLNREIEKLLHEREVVERIYAREGGRRPRPANNVPSPTSTHPQPVRVDFGASNLGSILNDSGAFSMAEPIPALPPRNHQGTLGDSDESMTSFDSSPTNGHVRTSILPPF